MRVEFIDIIFEIAERAADSNYEPTPADVYRIVGQVLGVLDPAVQPYGGFRARTQKYLLQADWPRFYDVVLRLARAIGFRDEDSYRADVNRLLAAYGVAWQMTEAGIFERVLPAPVAESLRSAIDELNQPAYRAARDLFALAADAFNSIPRRDRDAVTNAFDAMESAAKTRLDLPTATFGAALSAAGQRGLLNSELLSVFERVNTLRNRQFGHGMQAQFALSPNEVDFVYVACVTGARFFARL
jgi:hypothetical protein